MTKALKKFLPIEIENSPILKGVSIPGNKAEREKHFLTFKKFVEKNRNIKKYLSEIEYILWDISLFGFNSSLMKYAKKEFEDKIKTNLVKYLVQIITLNRIVIDIILQKQQVLYLEEYKLEKEYNLKIKLLLVNIESILKNMLSRKQAWWYKMTTSDIDNILKEVHIYLKAELIWLKNTKKSYFESWLKTENLWLNFYEFKS